MRVAVAGHVEWTEFARVREVPAPGQIAEASESWEVAAGGGAVAAVELARLAGACLFVTALGDDELGHRAHHELEAMGVELAVAWRDAPQRRAFVHLDDAGERAITTIGERHHPTAADELPWAALESVDGVYLTAADAGGIRNARAARRLVATPRVGPALAESDVELDALVLSAGDRGETYFPGELDPPPRAVVRTAGSGGGTTEAPPGTVTEWRAAEPPGPWVDAHGAGDSFAAGLTYALAAGRSLDAAVAFAARRGAAATARRGPYGDSD